MRRPIGSHLVHPVHGPTVLTERRMRKVGGKRREYAVLKHVTQDLTLLLPADSIDELDMRPVLNPDDAAELLELLAGEPSGLDMTWRVLRASNEGKLRSGEATAIAEVVRDLHGKKTATGLSPSERDMFRTARARLVSELDIALEADADEAVDAALRADEPVAA